MEPKGASLGRFLRFENMISGLLIQIMYLLGVVVIIFASIGMISRNTTLAGVALLIFGNLFWRLVCEGTILFFRVHETLVSIETKLTKEPYHG